MTTSLRSLLATLPSTLPYVLLALGLTTSGRAYAQPSTETPARPLDHWVVPAGFHVSTFADHVDNAREMALGPRGTVFVGSMRAGKVYAVVPGAGDRTADRVVVIASGLTQPNGVAVRNGALYVATTSRILRYDDIERHLDAPPTPVVVRDSLPNPSVCAIDPSGRLAWQTNAIDGDHVVAILSARVSDAYLGFLRARGVSYLLAGAPDVDLALALEKLHARFGVRTLMLEGGGAINGGLLRAGLIDEVSVLVAPVADGRVGTAALFDVAAEGVASRRLALEHVERRADDILWLRYRVAQHPE